MPFKNQHSYRVADPAQFESFARKNIAPGVDIILGLAAGKSTAQAYRFNAGKFTAKAAKAWLKEHDIKGGEGFTSAKKTDGKKAIPGEPHSPYANAQDPAAQYITPEEAKAKIAENSLSNVINTRKLIDPDYGVNAGAISIEHGSQKGSGKIKKKDADDMKKDEGKAALELCAACGGSGDHSECAGRGCETCDDGFCPDCGGEGFSAGKKDSADMPHFTHYDSMPMTPSFMVNPFHRTAEGFLKGRPVVTNVGVFSYKGPKGQEIRELRLPEEVFDSASLDSLRLKPVTNNHPKEKVSSINSKKYQIGSVGDNPSQRPVCTDGSPMLYSNGGNSREYSDGFRLSVDMIITDEATINDVLEGKRALSCGYECDSEAAEPGAKWMGMPYDYIQRKIRYNHVAIVDTARAGDDAVIRLDSADPDGLVHINFEDHEEVNMPTELKKFNLDGEEYQADSDFIKLFKAEKTRADKAEKKVAEGEEESKATKTDAEKMKAQMDSLKDENKQLKDELAEFKKNKGKGDSADILAAVNKRVDLLVSAKKVGLVEGTDYKNDSADIEIKKAVVLKLFPKADLTDKSEEYLAARYDSALETVVEKTAADIRTAVHGDSGMPAGGAGAREDSANTPGKARDNFMREQYFNSRAINDPAKK